MPGRILVIRGGAIGDFILTLPAIRLLRESFADSHLEILGYRHIASLADGRFYADAVRSIEYGPLAGFFNPRSNLDPELCEYFASFHQIISYIYDPDGLFQASLRRAGAKNILPISPKITDQERAAFQLAGPLQQLALWLDNPAAEFFPSAEDRVAAQALLGGPAGRLLALHPGSGSAQKNWPIEHWITLVQRLSQDPRIDRLVIVGGEADQERLALLRGEVDTGDALFLEKLPLPVLGAAFAECGFFLGHDSGISHLAAAAGIPCLLLFGPTDPEVWAPANRLVSILEAPEGILAGLDVATVLDKVEETFFYAH